jgi:signal transduction histidine kinase
VSSAGPQVMSSGVGTAPGPLVRRRLALPVRNGRARYVGGVAALAAAYYGAARLGYELEFAGPVAAIVWLPAGIAIGFLSLGGLRWWPGVLIGDLLANQYAVLPVGSALGQTLGNMAEVLVAAVLIRRLLVRGSPLDRAEGIGRLLMAILAGTAISAIVGSLSLRAGGVVSTGELPDVARTWWLGDVSGAVVTVPLALAWLRPQGPGWARGRGLEAVLMLAAVAALSQLAFGTESPLAYLVFPALGWAALRFGRRGATLAIAVAVGFAVWNTTHYHGPFVYESIPLSVLSTQLYIFVAALSTLSLAALVSERRQFAAGLAASRARLVKASDTERRRLEHNLHDGAQQRLTALAATLGLAADRAHEAREPGAADLDFAGSELVLVLDELRDLSHGIHPSVLTDLGLAAALRVVGRRSSIPVTFVDQLPSRRFDETVEATAYYVFAEALTNAQKHAHASSIQLRATATAHALGIEIADDGIGGAREATSGGLTGLRDRVEALGGTFDVHSPSGHGTRITAAIPLPRPEKTEAYAPEDPRVGHIAGRHADGEAQLD